MSKRLLVITNFDVVSIQRYVGIHGVLVVSMGSKYTLADGDAALFILSAKEKVNVTSANHWKKEVQRAIEHGKNIYSLMTTDQEVVLSERSVPTVGNGRTAVAVSGSLYAYLFDLGENFKLEKMFGSTANFIGKFNNLLNSDIIEKFRDIISFQFHICDVNMAPLIKDGDNKRNIGGIYKCKDEANLILLPQCNIHDRADISVLLDTILCIEENLQRNEIEEIPPEWLQQNVFNLSKEEPLIKEITECDDKITKLNEEKGALLDGLDQYMSWKGLLFLNGNALEGVVHNALELLGFQVKDFRDGDVEIDIIAESNEGGFIGEIEGKDNKAINVNKFRQLQDHIQCTYEDSYGLNPVDKGVLFGNGCRLSPPDERIGIFTDACVNRATGTSAALVSTVELFNAVKYVLDNPEDEGFKKSCREKILNTVGEVDFAAPHVKLKVISNG